MVGAGALGCEFLKEFALVGLGCSESGKVNVVDNDRIEISNRNRQFLFKEEHIGRSKAFSAVESAVAINPELKA